jgi:outer membrane immunogenic protein
MAKASYLAGVALALVAGSALAADLPSRKAPPPAFVPPPPAFSWSGLYGGVNIGYGFGDGSSVRGGQLVAEVAPGVYDNFGPVWNTPSNLNGVLGGGQLGYNYQFAPWLVLGVEADIQAADLRSSQGVGSAYVSPNAGALAGYTNTNQYVDWFGTVRGRIGLVMPSWPNLMVYGTGGFAYGGAESAHRYTLFNGAGSAWQSAGTISTTSTGWTAGGGVEWSPMSFPSWSVKVEYLYTDLGSLRDSGTGFAGFGGVAGAPAFLGTVNEASLRWHTVRAGLNWHFNPFAASAPVLAKY